MGDWNVGESLRGSGEDEIVLDMLSEEGGSEKDKSSGDRD